MNTNKKKTFITVGIAVLLILTTVIGIFAFSGKPSDKPILTPPAVTDGDGNSMNAETVYTMPKAMVFRSAQLSESDVPSVTIKAKIQPENATNQKVDWTVAWVNSGSEWAAGKSVADYVTVTPIADGDLTAKVNCLNAFAEQIKIVVTSRENSSAKAECSVDYAKKLTKTNLSYSKSYLQEDKPLSFIGGPNYLYLFTDIGSTGPKAAIIDYVTSVGTINDTYKTKVTLSFEDQFIRNALSYNGTVISQVAIDVSDSFGVGTQFVKMLFGNDTVNDGVKYNKLVHALSMLSGSGVFKFTAETTGEYGSKTDIYNCSVSVQFMSIRTTGITIENSTLVF